MKAVNWPKGNNNRNIYVSTRYLIADMFEILRVSNLFEW